jgi:hypothetical protein
VPRPPTPANERPYEDPAEGSRETVEHELKHSGDKARKRGSKADVEEKLDRAVEMTFPASDPPLPGNPTGNERASQPQGRQAPLISREDVQRARSGSRTPDRELAPGDDAPAGTPGTGEDICPVCNGRGRVDGATCPNCVGRGKVIKGVGGA